MLAWYDGCRCRGEEWDVVMVQVMPGSNGVHGGGGVITEESVMVAW